jgi:hypothetical protein
VDLPDWIDDTVKTMSRDANEEEEEKKTQYLRFSRR